MSKVTGGLICGVAGIALGVGLSVFGFKLLASKYGNVPRFYFEATYFVEVPKVDFEEFSVNLFHHLGALRSTGYIMGTSNMVTIRADFACGDDTKLEAYLEDYVGGNQFVCFMVRRVK